MTEKRPLSWTKIWICAILAGPVALGLTYLVLAMLGGDALEMILWVMIAALAYLPLTALVAFFLSLFLIGHRRLAHTLLATLFSVPVAAAGAWLFSVLSGG